MSIMLTFSRAVYQYRKAHHLSQEKMAERCGISVAHYKRFEKGETNVGLDIALRIAEVSEVRLDGLNKREVGTIET